MEAANIMDRQTDPAFFTDEEIANFAEHHISEQGIRINISSSSISSVHPDLKDVVSDELDLKDATFASIVPMASALAKVREEEEKRELQRYKISLPYFHDESRYHQMMMNSPDDDHNERERFVETNKENTTFLGYNSCSDANESDGTSISSFNQGTEQEVGSITINEHNHDDISDEVNYEEVHKTSSDCSSEDDNEEDNNEVEDSKLQTKAQQQCSNVPRKKSSYSNVNASIVAQKEKIRDICNNRQKSSKKKKQVRRGNYFREVRQKCGDEPSEEEEQSHEEKAAHPRQRQEEVDEKSKSGASEGFLDTEDEQSDDLIEFETQTERPIARKRKNNSLLETSEAIGSSIAKAVTEGGGESEWISRATKRRSKLKKRSITRVSLDTSSSPQKTSSNKQKSTAEQHQNFGGRRSVGFGAAPKAVSKRKTQLSLLHMLKK